MVIYSEQLWLTLALYKKFSRRLFRLGSEYESTKIKKSCFSCNWESAFLERWPLYTWEFIRHGKRLRELLKVVSYLSINKSVDFAFFRPRQIENNKTCYGKTNSITGNGSIADNNNLSQQWDNWERTFCEIELGNWNKWRWPQNHDPDERALSMCKLSPTEVKCNQLSASQTETSRRKIEWELQRV